jgi:hypothetical protein
MRIIIVFFILIFMSCHKDECYNCTQTIKIYSNKIIKGYPKNYKTKFISCGENIDLIDTDLPVMVEDTIGDTIFTYWKDTECLVRQQSF